MVYRFRVTYEEHEDVYRDIDIKSSQTFSDFHSIIQQAISFDNSKSASFFTSDDYWRREEEIYLTNSENDKNKKGKKSLREEAPKKKTIADFVIDPHQKFLYIFDPEQEWTFEIELLKILTEDKSVSYPICIKSSGASPKQYKETNLPPPPPEEEEEEPKKVKDGKEKLMEMAEEKAEMDEEDEGMIPLKAEDVEIEGEEEEKNPDEDDAEELGLDEEDI